MRGELQIPKILWCELSLVSHRVTKTNNTRIRIVSVARSATRMDEMADGFEHFTKFFVCGTVLSNHIFLMFRKLNVTVSLRTELLVTTHTDLLVQNFDSGLLVEQKNDSLIQSTLNLVSMSQFYHQICQSERRKSLCTGQKSMRTTGFTIIR